LKVRPAVGGGRTAKSCARSLLCVMIKPAPECPPEPNRKTARRIRPS
jgi:hypothetical protein